MTEEHLVFVYDPSRDGMKEKMAGLVVVGERVLYSEMINEEMVSQLITVTKVSSNVLQGVYGLITTGGTLIVNGVLVSCYGSISSQRIAHAVMAPLRFWYYGNNSFKNVKMNVAKYIEHITTSKLLRENELQNADGMLQICAKPWSNSLQQEGICAYSVVNGNNGVHGYVEFLKNLRRYLSFENFY